ncbi:MAG: hypothetical protein M3141_06635, partial [Actinomycetota bacterium]|nr:hypothetical protein [Actinomycetota bacterium]
LLVRHRRDLRPSVAIVPRIALAAGIAVAPCIALGLAPAISVVVASVLFFTVLWLVRAIPEEVIDAAQQRLGTLRRPA